MTKYIEKEPEQARARWHVIYGAYVPQIDYKNETVFVPVIRQMVKWVEEYPKLIGIRQGKPQTDGGRPLQILHLDRHFQPNSS